MVYRVGELRIPKTKFKTSNYCIAYLDILGTKEKISNDNNNEFLNYLNMLYEDAIEECNSPFSIKKEDIFIKIFSDNILIAIPIDKKDENRIKKIEKLICIVANIQNEIIREGYFVRGAIVEGEFFKNDIFVYGKALAKAVKLEEEIAIYPRVIVEKEIYELFPHYFYPSGDGNYFINNFIFWQGLEESTVKYNLLEALKMNKDNEKVKQKIMWLISYFNTFNQDRRNMGDISAPLITQEEINKIV